MKRFTAPQVLLGALLVIGLWSVADAQVVPAQTFTAPGIDASPEQSAQCNTGTLQVSGTGTWTIVPQGSNDNGATFITIPTIGGGSITGSGTFSGALAGYTASFFRFSVTAVSGSVTIVKSCTSQVIPSSGGGGGGGVVTQGTTPWQDQLVAGSAVIGSIANSAFAINGAIPAGSNTIGFIGNSAFGITGPLPTGTNAIGSITNTSFGISGSLPSGTNTIGVVGIGTGIGSSAGNPLFVSGGGGSSTPNYAMTSNQAAQANSAYGQTCLYTTTAVTVTNNNVEPCLVDVNGNSLTRINVALPAGTNSIGTVVLGAGAASVGTIANTAFGISGSLPAGTNSIGTVVLGTGAATIGSIANTGFAVTGSLPSGTNTIGVVGIGTGIGSTAGNPLYVSGSSSGGTTVIANSSASPVPVYAPNPINVVVTNPTAAPTSLPAGTNSIGTVVLGAGSASIGTIGNTAFGITGSLPAGTNAIGTVTVANQISLTNAGVSATTNVAAIQGVTGGVAVPVSGSLTVNTPPPTTTVAVTQATSPWVVTTAAPCTTATCSITVNTPAPVTSVTVNTPAPCTVSTCSSTVSSVGAANIATGQISVTTTATLVAASRTGAAGTGRTSIAISNPSTGTAIYVGGPSVTSANGVLVAAGGAINLNTTAAVFAITASGTSTVSEYELY